jgi:hypothetical protein
LFASFPEHIAGYHVLLRFSMPRHPPYTLKSLTTFIDHRHQGVVNGPQRPRHFRAASVTRSITNQYRQKGARRRPPDGKDLTVRGWGIHPSAGAGIAEVSSFGLHRPSSRPPLARQSLERPAHPGMNLLLNLKRLHLSKSNQLVSLVRRMLATGSVDEFFPSNTGETAESYGG